MNFESQMQEAAKAGVQSHRDRRGLPRPPEWDEVLDAATRFGFDPLQYVGEWTWKNMRAEESREKVQVTSIPRTDSFIRDIFMNSSA